MDTELKKKYQSAVMNLLALRDLMSFIVNNSSEDKIDKCALYVFLSCLDVALNELDSCID